jgi:HlyD family secretion protein
LSPTTKLVLWLVFGFILAYAAGFTFAAMSNGKARFVWWLPTHERFDGPIHVVKKEKLQLAIVERGALESAENSEIMCQVKAGARGGTIASTIKWVIDDGTEVKRGQQLIELDYAGLEDQFKDQSIKVDQANASAVAAKAALQIQQDQNYSDIETAKVAVENAGLSLTKYIGDAVKPAQTLEKLTRDDILKLMEKATSGEYVQKRDELLGNKETARSSYEMWVDRASWSQRMVVRGFVTRSQAEADRASKDGADINLKNIEAKLEILEKFDKRLTVTDLQSKLEEANRALARVLKQASAKEEQLKADSDSKTKILDQEGAKLKEIREEIEKCKIPSPQDGLVVYYLPEQSRFGSGSQQSIVAQGEPVREGQKLMRIPNLYKMQVNVRVHEAMVSKLDNESYRPRKITPGGDPGETRLIRLGLICSATPWDGLSNFLPPAATAQAIWHGKLRDDLRRKDYDRYFEGHLAYVRVDAHPSYLLKARVKTVANVASQAEFFSSDVKVYQTTVSIDDESMELLKEHKITLKPGMSAETTILADDSPQEVLTVPIQSVVGGVGMGGKRKVFIINAVGEPEERDVETGRSNENKVEVLKGLSEGDEIVLNPQPLLVGERSKLKQAPMNTKRGGQGGWGGDMKGKGKGTPGSGAPGMAPPGAGNGGAIQGGPAPKTGFPGRKE